MLSNENQFNHYSKNGYLSVLPTNSQYAPSGFPAVRTPSGIGFIPVNDMGGVQWVDLTTTRTIYEAINKCAPLASILNRMADAFVAGKFEVLNRSTDNYVRGKYKDWERLLEKPNKIQSRKNFFKQLYFEVKAVGRCFIMPTYAAGFNDRPSELWVIPNQCIQLEQIRFDVLPSEYMKLSDIYRAWFVWGAERRPLDLDAMIKIYDSTPINPITFLPDSRLIPLRYPISNLIASYEARCTLIQKRGALGILTNNGKSDGFGTMPIPQEEKDDVQRQFMQGYGLTRGQAQVIVTTAALSWQQMAMNTKDLQLHEEHLADVKDICDAFGFPMPLIAHSDQSTYSNMDAADGILYQNTIIPQAEDIIGEQLDEGLKCPENNIRIRMDYSDIPALQQSEKDKGLGLKSMNDALKIEWDNGLITRNQWLEAIGKDTVQKPEFNMYKFELTAEQAQMIGDAPQNQGASTTSQPN